MVECYLLFGARAKNLTERDKPVSPFAKMRSRTVHQPLWTPYAI